MSVVVRNVNDAFEILVTEWQKGEDSQSLPLIRSESRNGPVVKALGPVTVTYRRPTERVLFNRARNCNPFFHVFESLWMLAGRNDVASLKKYVSTIDQFSDDGETFNGAYGHRWRHATRNEYRSVGQLDGVESCLIKEELEVDQLKIIIEHLKADPNSRRAVLQMWNVEDDLMKIGSLWPCPASGKGCVKGVWENGCGRALIDGNCPICKGTGFEKASKDVCCNLSAVFSIRNIAVDGPEGQTDDVQYLDMTVFNRSNDLIWGMLGANVVHFSFLQEYVAAHLGVSVGVYHQVTADLHVYVARKDYKPEEWLAGRGGPNYYRITAIMPTPLVKDPATFDKELIKFIDNDWSNPPNPRQSYLEPFLANVAEPMCRAWYFHKNRDYGAALHWAAQIRSYDWRIACTNWLESRKNDWEQRQTKGEATSE